MWEETKIMEYSNRFIAFLDILGFKSIIEQTITDKKVYKNVLNTLNYISEVRRENYKGFLSEYGILKEVSVFSDSIVISYSYDIKGGLFYILMDLVFICFDLTANGMFVRGGVTYGELYHKESVCFGPAMIRAYKLESKQAVYPRIIVDRDALQKGIKYHASANTPQQEKEYLQKLLCKDEKDQYYFLDFLSQYQEFDEPEDEYLDFLLKVKEHTKQRLLGHKDSIKIYQKYHWFAKYYNTSVNRILDASFIKDNDLLIPKEIIK